MSVHEKTTGQGSSPLTTPCSTAAPEADDRAGLPVPTSAPAEDGRIYLGTAVDETLVPCYLHLPRANRHGLIAGQTGTGKTVTLQVLAEGFVRAGVPVLLTDVKGDLAGLSQPGALTPGTCRRWGQLRQAPEILAGLPVTFWDVIGAEGVPMRLTVSGMGPASLSRLLGLSEAQDGALAVAFRIAQDVGLPLVDLDDLRAILVWMHGNAAGFAMLYGAVTPHSVATLQRKLIAIEAEGLDKVLGEPGLDLDDVLERGEAGEARVNILVAEQLIRAPRLYGAVLIWLLSSLLERLPEVGDEASPRLVLFFEEAHLLFRGAPRLLVEKLEQTVRLMRSKGVGVYFVTQSPTDIPGSVLGQLGNRILHAMRGYTPRDQRALRAAADAFRTNPAFHTADVLPDMGVGEALVSTLEISGEPAVVRKVRIRPPGTQVGAIDAAVRRDLVASSAFSKKYRRDARSETRGDRVAPRLEAAFGTDISDYAATLNTPASHTSRSIVPVRAAPDLLPRRLHHALVAWIDQPALLDRIARHADRLGRRLARSLINRP